LRVSPRPDIPSPLPLDSHLRPQVVVIDGEEHVNLAAVLITIFEAGPNELTGKLREPARRYRERVRASMEAQRIATGREPCLFTTLAACAGADKHESTWADTLEQALLGEGPN
jgi:hypothetical protein